MADELRFLTEDDVAKIRGMDARIEALSANNSRTTPPPRMSLPGVETYVARTPDGGITALDPGIASVLGTGTTPDAYGPDIPGSADCTVYQLAVVGGDAGPAVLQVLADEYLVTVYNLGAAVPGDTWVLVTRDRFGTWWVAETDRKGAESGGEVALWANCRVITGAAEVLANSNIPTILRLSAGEFRFQFSVDFGNRRNFTWSGYIANNDYFYESYSQRTSSSVVVRTASGTDPVDHFGIDVHGKSSAAVDPPDLGTGTGTAPDDCSCNAPSLCLYIDAGSGLPNRMNFDSGYSSAKSYAQLDYIGNCQWIYRGGSGTLHDGLGPENVNSFVWSASVRYENGRLLCLINFVGGCLVAGGELYGSPQQASADVAWDCASDTDFMAGGAHGTWSVHVAAAVCIPGVNAPITGTGTALGQTDYYCTRTLYASFVGCACNLTYVPLVYRLVADAEYQTTNIDPVSAYFSDFIDCSGTRVVVEMLDNGGGTWTLKLWIETSANVWQLVLQAAGNPAQLNPFVFNGSVSPGILSFCADGTTFSVLQSTQCLALSSPQVTAFRDAGLLIAGPYPSQAKCLAACNVGTGTGAITGTGTGGGGGGTIIVSCCANPIPVTLHVDIAGLLCAVNMPIVYAASGWAGAGWYGNVACAGGERIWVAVVCVGLEWDFFVACSAAQPADTSAAFFSGVAALNSCSPLDLSQSGAAGSSNTCYDSGTIAIAVTE